MKIRSDFVTNSSSSSFIIGKKENTTITIESVFSIIKNLYIELNKNMEAAKKHCKDTPDYPIKYDDENNSFRFKEKRTYDKKEKNIERKFENKFRVNTFTYIYGGTEWLKCDTYKDYEDFWVNKKALDSRNIAPFEIYDYFSYGKIKSLMWGQEEIDKNIGLDNDELAWYYPYIEELFKNDNISEICLDDFYDKSDAIKTMDVLSKANGLTEENICLNLLGRVCISSESGYIPEYVTEKLSKISEHYCNHMG